MKKFIKLFTPLLFVINVFMLFSCNQNNGSSSYKIFVDGEDNKLTYNDENFKKEYNNNDLADFTGLVVKFNDVELSYSETVNEDDTHYFVCNNSSNPTSNLVKKDSTYSTTERESQFTVYISFKTEVGEKETIYMRSLQLTVKNTSAVSKWMTYLVTGILVVTFAFASYVVYKKKKSNQQAVKPVYTQTFEEDVKEENKETDENKEEKQDAKENNIDGDKSIVKDEVTEENNSSTLDDKKIEDDEEEMK